MINLILLWKLKMSGYMVYIFFDLKIEMKDLLFIRLLVWDIDYCIEFLKIF